MEINVNRCAGIGRIKTRCGETMISADFANVVAVGQRPGLSCIAVLKSGYTTVYTLHMYQPTRPNIPSSRSSNFLHYVLLSRPSILPIIFRLINVEYVFSLFIFARSRVCDFFLSLFLSSIREMRYLRKIGINKISSSFLTRGSARKATLIFVGNSTTILRRGKGV